MKKQMKFSAILAALLGTGGGLLALLTAHATVPDPTAPTPAPVHLVSSPAPAAAAVVPTNDRPTSDAPGVLDGRRQFALSMIETGMDDNEIGGAGEISRYQIMPSVWEHYSHSRRYRDPAVSLAVARRHWTALYAGFKQQAHREPTDFDMYVLWNTRYGFYASRGFKPARLPATVRDRAERFVNLVERDAAQRALATRTGPMNAEKPETTQKG